MHRLLALLISSASAFGSVPDKWIDLIGWVESRNNPAAVGDSSRAHGEMQFWRATWNDCSRLRAAKGLPVWSYDRAHDKQISCLYARSWLESIDQRLTKALGRRPSLGEVYAAYNLGMGGFASRGYSLARCPLTTRRAAAWLNLSTVKH